MRLRFQRNFSSGFSLVETVIAIAIFAIVAIGLYASVQRVLGVVRRAQLRVATTELGTELLEIAHNLPYAQVGTKTGIPNGSLPAVQTVVRENMTFVATTTVRNLDLPFDGLAPADTNPSDDKIVQLDLLCTSCKDRIPMSFTAQIGPKDLEASSAMGSLFVRTIDASGNPVPQAQVHVVASSMSPAIDLWDQTMDNGYLQLVGAPPGVNAYRVYVSKAGYSSDQTYSKSGPTTTHPVLPDATIATGTVTQLTFAIDRLAQLNVSSVSPVCTAIPNVPFNMTGAKLIGTEPVYKYSKNLTTDASGNLSLPNTEWDKYTVTVNMPSYDVVGTNPPSPFQLSPGATQNLQLVLVPITGNPNDNTLMVTVLDSVTNLPLSGADVLLNMPAQGSFDLTTGRGFIDQTDWSGGAGQVGYVVKNQYATDDGNIGVGTVPGSVLLKKTMGNYAPHGELYSSTFDLGSASNFYQLLFTPTTQPGGTSVRLQLATSASSTGPWNFTGPDGTAATYYTATSSTVAAVNNGAEFVRYRLLLDTTNPSNTPEVDDVSFTFASLCSSPGQAAAQGLHNGSWTATVSAPGYQTEQQTVVMDTSKPWGQLLFTLDPS